MVSQQLSDYNTKKTLIVTKVASKISSNLFDENLHDSFRDSKLKIDDVELMINSIERRLRELEVIYYTHFGSEYDSSIIINGSLILDKIIETEFFYSTEIITNRITINSASLYKEIIDDNFRSFILTVASLYEVLVRLTETLTKKIVLYDGLRSPYQSIPLMTMLLNWDRLLDLDYRIPDTIYSCYQNHRLFLNKYLLQINNLRNRFIHGYSINLEKNILHNKYMVINHRLQEFPQVRNGGIITELVVNDFVKNILNNTQTLVTDILNGFVTELSVPNKEIPL